MTDLQYISLWMSSTFQKTRFWVFRVSKVSLWTKLEKSFNHGYALGLSRQLFWSYDIMLHGKNNKHWRTDGQTYSFLLATEYAENIPTIYSKRDMLSLSIRVSLLVIALNINKEICGSETRDIQHLRKWKRSFVGLTSMHFLSNTLLIQIETKLYTK